MTNAHSDKFKPCGIYVHIPFCKSKCKYCAFVSSPDMSCEDAYLRTLIGEIDSSADKHAAVDSIYIGGGTPSCLARGELCKIFDSLDAAFDIADDCEITVETNPESCSDGFISECLDCGVNRVSMGLQSSDDSVLKAIGRIHDFSDFVVAAERLCQKFDNVSSDLILGLPEQGMRDVEKSIDVFSRYCSHASVYALTVENGTPLALCGYKANDDAVADLYDRACEKLKAAGFCRYEVSNFARRGRESRHNKKYWECEKYIGLGVAAHGYDGMCTRYRHSDNIAEYIANPSDTATQLDAADLYNEYVMLRLRTEKGIELDTFRKRFGYPFAAVNGNSDKLKRMEADGLIICDGGSVRISPRYMFVMNGIIEELMLDRETDMQIIAEDR